MPLLPQSAIDRITLKQLRMASHARDRALIHYDDLIRRDDIGQFVRDHEKGQAPFSPYHRRLPQPDMGINANSSR